MKVKRLLIYHIIILLTALNISMSYGQTEATFQQLDKLDSLAFEALENNAIDASAKANDLLEKCNLDAPTFHAANAHTILGILNKNKGYYITSINHYLNALNISEKIKDTGRVSACLNNIGTLYLLQNNYPKALVYFNQSLEIEKTQNNPIQKSIRYFNIGDTYKKLDSLDLALSFFTNSLLIEQKEQSLEGIIYAKLGISEVYINLGRLVDAENILNPIDSLIQENQTEERVIFQRLKATLALQQDQPQQAIQILNSTEATLKKNELRSLLPEIFLLQIKALERQKDWFASHNKYKELTELREDLNNINIKNQLADLSFQNDLNKKNLELALIKEERDLAQQTAENEKNIRAYSVKITWFLIISIIIIIVLIALAIKFNVKE